MCCNIFQANGGDINDGQMTVRVENRMCLPDLGDRWVGSFRKLTWLCTPDTVRNEEMDRGQICQTRIPTFSLFQWWVFHFRIVCFNRSG